MEFADRKIFNAQKIKDFNFYPLIKDSLSFEKYSDNFKKIKELIAAGEVYQINYTKEIELYSKVNDWRIFLELFSRQPTEYSAFIQFGESTIISLSPELFFSIKNRIITVKPMKGTAPLESEYELDSVKNRSENLMIVDLLRNDLLKFCSNLRIDKLFEVERYPTLLQMTSTIRADLSRVGLKEVVTALFPCGSVTGCPKQAAIDYISEIENFERGVYCGAIGLISKDESLLSVGIRTLHRHSQDSPLRYGVGSGIVEDSHMIEEWKEWNLKTKFLSPVPDFNLIETIKGDYKFLEFHHERLINSAKRFSFNFLDIASLERFKATLPPPHDGITRLELSFDGQLKIQKINLTPIQSRKIQISKTIQDSRSDIVFHKTSRRERYRESNHLIEMGLIFDQIFTNERGELTEGSRSNVIIEIGSMRITPHINSGLLAGIGRAMLLRSGWCLEAAIPVGLIYKAERVWCVNSVRGLVEVNLDNLQDSP